MKSGEGEGPHSLSQIFQNVRMFLTAGQFGTLNENPDYATGSPTHMGGEGGGVHSTGSVRIPSDNLTISSTNHRIKMLLIVLKNANDILPIN